MDNDVVENVLYTEGKVWVQIEKKINLGNYESKTYSIGVSIPHRKDKDEAVRMTSIILQDLNRELNLYIEKEKLEKKGM
jgi:hypothetical protein